MERITALKKLPQHCKRCKRVLRKYNKSGLCSVCGEKERQEQTRLKLKDNKGLILMAFIFAFTLCFVNFANAELFQFDNIKQYDAVTKEVTIINTFGLGQDIAKIKLNTDWCLNNYDCKINPENPTEVILSVGYQQIAELQINNFEDYNSIMDKMEIYNIKNTELTKTERQFDYKIKALVPYEVNDYSDKQTCIEDIKFQNGTQICSYEIIGKHTEYKEDWIALEKFDFLKGDIVTLGIFTQVYLGDNVEWIPTLYGKVIDDWASYVQSSGTQTFIDISGVNYTVLTFTSNGTFNVTGDILNISYLIIAGGGAGYSGGGGAGGLLFNNSYNVSAGNYGVFVGKGGNNGTGGVNGRKGQDSSFNGIIAYGGGLGGGVGGLATSGGSGGGDGANKLDTGGEGIAGQGYAGGTGRPTPYPAGGGGGSNGEGGSGIQTNGTSGNGGDGRIININGTSVCWAGGGGGGRYNATIYGGYGGCGGGGVGTLDNNASGNAINGTGGGGGGGGGTSNGGSGGYGIVIIRYLSVVSSRITLNSPISYFNTTNPQINFNVSVTDNLMVQNVSLYIDNILNETNTSNINGTYIFTRYLSEGIHNWSILSYNNDSNPSQSLTRYFTIDYTSPIINFINPTPLNNSYITNNSININISSFDYSDFSTIANFDKSLKGYWSMDYYNSIWIFDNSSYNNSFKFFGEVRANNITSGIRGNGSNFNGVNSYLALDNSYNFTSNNTLSFWAKINVQESQGIIGRNGTSITDYLRFGKNAPTHNQIIYGETNTDTDFIELDFKGVYNALSYDTWYHFVIIEDNNLNWSLWINGLYQTSYTTTNPNITFQRLGNSRNLDFLNGSLDEVMIFNRSLSEKEIKALYNSKVNNFDVPFSGLTEDRHDYIIYEIDTLGNFNQSSMNFIINTTYPVINIVYPQNITYYLTSITSNPNAIRWFNWTASDIGGNLDKCWYSSDNGGTNYSIICNANASFSSAYGTKTLIAWANDTLNHLTREDKTATFKYKIFELNQSFNTPVLENTPQDYYANIYTDSSLSINSVYFNYNGTNYSGGYSVIGNYTRLEKLNFYSPSVITDANNTITWWVLLDDSSRIVLSTNYQIVNNLIYSGVCNSTYPYYLFNLTLKDERTQLDINGTIETDIRFKTSNGTINLFNWTSTLYNTSSYLCSNLPISSGNSYTVDGTIKYYASNENYSAMVEYYNFLNFSYNNNTYYQNISLYDLNTTEGTEFQLTFKDSAFRTRENILIYVYRQYLPEGIFKVVELPKTDSNGQTVLHLVRNDVIYNIIAVDSAGNILGVLNNVIAFCEDYTIGDCKINFQGTTIETDLENYIEDLGLSYTLSFDSATNIISFVFSSDTLQVKNIRLQVISTAVITNRTICDTSLSAITGTLTCDVSSVVNSSSSVYVKIFLDNVEIINESLSLDNSNWNVPGVLFFGFLLLLIIGIMFIESKEGLIIAVILGFIVLISLGIAKGKIIGFTSGVLWLIIVGVILLIKLNKEKKQG